MLNLMINTLERETKSRQDEKRGRLLSLKRTCLETGIYKLLLLSSIDSSHELRDIQKQDKAWPLPSFCAMTEGEK